MSGSTTLTPAEILDVRRFLGYPFEGAVYLQVVAIQGGSQSLDDILAALTTDQATVIRSYLTQLRILEVAIPNAGALLQVAKAAVFTRNPTEVEERISLYQGWRRQLSYIIGVPLGNGAIVPTPAAFLV
jgi:hypothetical protein